MLNILRIQIKESTFSNNQVVNDGGAIYVDKGKNTSVRVEDCEFFSNKAGVNPFDVDLTITGYQIGYNLPAAYGFQILTDNLLRLDMEFNTGITKNETILLNIRGSGGAIAVKHADEFDIKRCTFVNNTANNYGGAIFAGSDVMLDVNNSLFLSGEVPSTLVGGILIQSYCRKFYLRNFYFEIVIPIAPNISAFYHSVELIKYSISLKNITVKCPLNTRLAIHNVTNDMQKTANNLKFASEYPQFNDLVYTCHQCLSGQYSLQRGHFKYWAEIDLAGVKDQLITKQ